MFTRMNNKDIMCTLWKEVIEISCKQEILPDNFRQHNYVNTITRYQIASINGVVVIYSSSDLHPDIDHVTFSMFCIIGVIDVYGGHLHQ